MNSLKKIFALLLAMCLILCVVGCEESYEPYDNFEPAGVWVVDYLNGNKYPTHIDDADYAKIMLDEFKKLDINTLQEGELDSAYLYLRFYDEDESTLLIFTIYENGSCCLGENYDELYTVTDGRQKYIDLCALYESYSTE